MMTNLRLKEHGTEEKKEHYRIKKCKSKGNKMIMKSLVEDRKGR